MKLYIRSSTGVRKYSQRELKELVKDGYAEDITNISHAKATELSGHVHQIGYSSGVYGVNGALLEDYDTGAWYAITARNSTLLTLI